MTIENALNIAKTLSYWQQRAEKAEATLAEARKILFSYGEKNDGTAHPWWAVVKKNRMGAQATCAGPFFSRERAEQHAKAREHEYGKTITWCFSGHHSQHYVALRKALALGQCVACDAPATQHDAEGVPLCDVCYQGLLNDSVKVDG